MLEHATSLVDVAPGETVMVRQIVFESPRTYCAELGVHEGDRVTRLESGLSTVLVREASGRVVRCPPDLARFVEVARCQGSNDGQQDAVERSRAGHDRGDYVFIGPGRRSQRRWASEGPSR
jgi:hypothetical protein